MKVHAPERARTSEEKSQVVLFTPEARVQKAEMLFRLIAPCVFLQTISASTGERRLIHDLLDGYDTNVRPVENSSLPVDVYMTLTPQQLIDVDEKNQVVKMNVWLKFVWHDHQLTWEPSDYDGVADIRFPSDHVWHPDVLLYNSVDSEFDATYQSNVVIYSDGTINWIPPGVVMISCRMDMTWFPFDEQVCWMKARSIAERL